MDAPLVLDGLRKSYDGREVVADFTMTVGRGEVVALVGPNGSGKTTSLEMGLGLRSRDAGSVTVLGIDPRRSPQPLVGRVGVQLQGAAIHPRVKVREHLDYVAASFGTRAQRDEIADMFDLQGELDTRFTKLSGGTKRRLMVASAFLVEPELAVLDEPTSGVDADARRSFWAGLRRAVRERGLSVVITTHDLLEVERHANRFVLMAAGHIRASGDVDQLRTQLGVRHVVDVPDDQVDVPADVPAQSVHAVGAGTLMGYGSASDAKAAGAALPADMTVGVREAGLEDLYLLACANGKEPA